MSGLKSCEYCKTGKNLLITHSYEWECFYVTCFGIKGGCGSNGPKKETEAEAIKAWNTRSGDAEAKLAKLQGAVKETLQQPYSWDVKQRLSNSLDESEA